MNWLPLLNFVEHYLNQLSKRQLFALYGTLFLLCFAFLYHFSNKEVLFSQPIANKTIYKQNSANTFDFMYDLELFLDKNNLVLTQFQEKKSHQFILKATGELQSLLLLVNFIEHYKTINSLKNIKLQHQASLLSTTLFLEFAFEKFLYDTHLFKTIQETILNHDFYTSSKKILANDANKKEETTITLSAIVNKRVLINNKWYEPFESINDLKIQRIEPKHVVFKNHLNQDITILLRP